MTTAIILLAALLSTSPRELVVTDHVDRVEENHFYDEHGKLVFDQLIFYAWDEAAQRFQIIAWRLAKHRTQMPFFDHSRQKWLAVWLDGDTLRMVTATVFVQSWTQEDPELLERSFLAKDQRREFSKIPKREGAGR